MSTLETLWTDLLRHRTEFETFHLRDAFAADPQRFTRYSAELDGCLTLDYSRNRITDRTLTLLELLLDQAGVREAYHRMSAGEKLNGTEDRSVLHIALRGSVASDLVVDGETVLEAVGAVKDRLYAFAHGVRDGQITASDGQPFTTILNLGIGGSDLGPRMVTHTLRAFHDGPEVHFVSNVDGAHIRDCLETLDPQRTLVLVASKSFTTQETMVNARAARAWIASAVGEEKAGEHFVALSSNLEAVEAFGIAPDRMFGFWDWVGGRYSVWSAIGLPVMLAIGPERFEDFLAGARGMDQHFATAPFRSNLPMLLAALGLWYRNIWACSSVAVMPYDQRFEEFPSFLQQLDMESNGKSTRIDGSGVLRASGPIIWGAAGTNGQHAFFQNLHQGTDMVPCDFLISARPSKADAYQHELLLASCFAQIEVLAFGRTQDVALAQLLEQGMAQDEAERLAPHKAFSGNRPTNLLLYEQLTPKMLGRIIALYEHKVFTQGIVWGVNSFDQWGVELGKELAGQLLPSIQAGARQADEPAIFHRLKAYREN
ncbi:MAG: glucose-6-phosphate isomerase [Cohaesibacter sp.]|jgi:glucose-6-phosphate isomerase|nr:glucose-6-phosphate isomerase [Cohaesibacter sp.]